MEFFRVVEIRENYINRIASGMSKYFYTNIFAPIFAILKDTSVLNSKEALLNAIKSGKIYYKNGAFRTQERFSNSISKTLESFGAKFKNGAYFIEESLIPLEYLQAISLVKTMTAAKLYAIQKFLDSYLFAKDEINKYIENAATEMFKTLEKDIISAAQEKNVPVIELGLVNPKIELSKEQEKKINDYWEETDKEIEKLRDKRDKAKKEEKEGKKPEISSADLQKKINEINKTAFDNAPKVEINDAALDEESLKIAQDYTYNMSYWVKKWEAKNIIKMRSDVLDMVQKGKRLKEIQKYFEEKWDIAKNKAFFLAKNESNIVSSVIQKNQFKKLGSNRFRWVRSTSKEKRKLHKTYYDRIFELDDPPIIDERTGQKGLPRQTYNCQCRMQIVVPDIKTQLVRRKEVKNSKTILNRIKNAIYNNKQLNNNIREYRRFDERQTV